MTTTDREYDKEARTILAQCGGTIRIHRSDSKSAPWCVQPQFRHHYRVTLKGPGGSYTFDFWGSIADAENGKDAKPYDVLACLEWYAAEDYQEFCSEFGYETDSRKAYQTWKACTAQRRALERIFPSQSAREALAEIR